MRYTEHITRPRTELPLVTVITPYYNNPEVGDAIQSVQRQTYPRIQYILVDDGSPTVPAETVEACLRNGPQLEKTLLLRHPVNQGTVKALNNAYRHAEGAYLFNLAADDRFADDRVLEDWVAAFQATGAQVVTGYRILFDHTLEHRLRKRPKPADVALIESGDSEKLFRRLCRKNTILGCCTAYSAECLRQYGFFDESYRIIEDYPRVLSLSRQGARFAFLRRDVVHCRTGGASSGGGYSEMYRRDADRIFEREILPFAKHRLWARSQYQYWKARQRLLKFLETKKKQGEKT